eukprot:CAMPEP_0197588436 /NCGR_PEP_ID=MMETSP1326-20131121/9721_1 /TAXON_ID=1155430 /ORGANISM="Genus nov. species nov., Strain RCC2288" /LENGTH=54 /DNA_ID=CAMNT_0043153263 /DNA_START=207 /DNA_END=367 /DNA_ORIENTATION=+
MVEVAPGRFLAPIKTRPGAGAVEHVSSTVLATTESSVGGVQHMQHMQHVQRSST